MLVTLVQMNSVIGDFHGNARRIVELTKRALDSKSFSGISDLIVFPELALCGYPPMDLLDQEAFVEGGLSALRYLQKELPHGAVVAIGYVDRNPTGSGKALRNVVSVIREGKIEFTQAKTLLPTYDVFDEARYFEPAKERGVFVLGTTKIGFAICEDFWWEAPTASSFKYSVDPVKELLDQGIDVLIVPSASPFVAGKLDTRLALARGAAKEGGIPVLYCNAVGANDSLVFDGRSFAVNPNGDIVTMAGWDETILNADTAIPSPPAEKSHFRNMEQVSRAEEHHKAAVIGIRDYMGKTGFSRACLGLSGGIDSALVAVLAAEALGPSNVTCLSMPSRFSSEGSVDDSVELCRRVGLRLERLPIETTFKSYLDLFAIPFAGRPFDLAEENLQARIRGTILMAWSNKFNALLLTTGNKSELAAGYCTLYGDMCGALAPIGDLYKTEVYELARYLNALAIKSGLPEPIPRPILEKAPSAELRLNQKDQDSLPEYETLDAILRQYIEENKTRQEIAATGFEEELVERVLAMTAKAEYKRRQAAPVIKVSARAFGIGRRLPLARFVHE
jgi:NAD+ synthase (glutamine-hydrolysing)